MDLRVFAPPHGLSQLITSFVASESQGIPHTPFLFRIFPFFTFPCACAQVVNLFSYQNLKFDNLFAFGFARYETLCVSTRFLSL